MNWLKVFVLALVAVYGSQCMADRDILLVTPNGVFRAVVVNGVPGTWSSIEADVIVQGFIPGVPVPPKDPSKNPPASDPTVAQIAAMSKTLLTKDSALALSAVIDALIKLKLDDTAFYEALTMAVPIAETSLELDGVLSKWVKATSGISKSPSVLRAGLQSAFDIQSATLDTIHEAAVREAGAALPEEAVDFAKIIEIVQLIIQLLKNLGII